MFREIIEALPAGLITVGSFFHPQLCGTPKLPFILPVREVLKSNLYQLFLYFVPYRQSKSIKEFLKLVHKITLKILLKILQ